MKKILLSLILIAFVSIDIDATINYYPTQKKWIGGSEINFPTFSGLEPGELAKILNTSTDDDSYVSSIYSDGQLMTVSEFRNILLTATALNFSGSKLNQDDLDAINEYLTSLKFQDMHSATLNCELSNQFKSKAKYIAFPAEVTNLTADVLTAANCPNLIGAGAYDATSKTFYGYSTTSQNQSFGEGDKNQLSSMKVISDMWNGAPTGNGACTKLVYAGHINIDDIRPKWSAEGLSDDDSKLSTPHTSGNGAVCLGIQEMDLQNAVFDNVDDMKFHAYASSLKTIKLPLGMTTLPSQFLGGNKLIESLCIPSNYTTIQQKALYGCEKLNHIYTTSTASYDDQYKLDYGERTITIAPTVTFIGTEAFATCIGVTDVYVLATTAPECEAFAFSTVSYVANNTLDQATGVVTRESYHCGDGYMAILHFPAECYDNNEVWKYTDPTRDFSIATEYRDERGNIVMWPNQAEMNRAFIQGTTGYLWNATVNTRVGGDGNDKWGFKNGDGKYQYGTGRTTEQYYDNIQDILVDGANNNSSLQFDTKYAGWHQFLLSSYGTTGDTDKTFTFNFGQVYDNEWWTICLPFPMTKKEMGRYFGQYTTGDETDDYTVKSYPKLCRLVSVDRVVDKKIVLNFGIDLVDAAQSDDDVVLVAGHPYMIKPDLDMKLSKNDMAESRIMRIPLDDVAEAKYVKTQEEMAALLQNNVETIAPEYIKIYKTLADYNSNNPAGTSTSEAGKAADTGVNKPYTNYTFVGSFWKYHLPQYSYFLGYKGAWPNGQVMYFWHDGEMDQLNRSWNTCTAIICPNWTDTGFADLSNIELETMHWNLGGFTQDDSYASAGGTSTSAVEMVFNAETDGISKIHMADGEVMTSVNGKIYNINGQQMGTDASSLPKGIYIVNGKKFIVK